MDFSGYEKEIQDLSLLIEKQYTLFDEGIFHSLGYLLGMAEKLDDESLKGYVYYQLADAYYSFHFDVDQMQLYLSKAIKSQQEVQDFSLLTRSHNLLGITEFLRGNFALALDYYMTALKYYEQMEEADNSLSGIVKSNIARLYFSLNDYDHGRYYAEEALYDISGTTVDSAYVSNMMSIYIFLGNIYLSRSRDVQAARACLESVLTLAKNSPYPGELLSGIDILSFSIRLAHYEDKLSERDFLIRRFVNRAVMTALRTHMIEDVCDLADFFMEIGKTEECRHVLHLLEAKLSEIGFVEIQKRFVESKIRFYTGIGDLAERNAVCFSFYELMKEQEKEKVSAFLFALGIRRDLEDLRQQNAFMEEENIRLTKKAEYDELTGLPNRYHLSDYSDAAFERAYNARTPIAFEMVDLDFFKQYNDRFGHQRGDECLKLVAEEIKKLCQRHTGIYAARYGGDEFVLIYENMSDKEILSYARELADSVIALNLKHSEEEGGVITISQGIRNSIPLKKNRVWDYTFAADMALFKVKGRERGGILLIHRAKLEGESMYV